MSILHLSVTETMAVDSMLPSPSSISTPMLGLEGLPGRRRKKRTSIESNVRVALERNFNTVRNSPNYQVYRALCLQVCTETLSQKHKNPSNYVMPFYFTFPFVYIRNLTAKTNESFQNKGISGSSAAQHL